MRSFSYLATAMIARSAAASVMGFNSGATLASGAVKVQSDYEAEFKTAAALVGSPGDFNSVRLYTMIQGGSTADPIAAFQAAMDTNTTMLLGIWCSGVTDINNELTALTTAITQYGTKFTDLVVGISVGSEDLYRTSVVGVTNKSGVGNSPDAITGFISDVRNAIKGTSLSAAPVGHTDTYDSFTNSSNKAVLDASDFLGIDAYPFYESDKGNNTISNALTLWDTAISAVKDVAGDKPYWITETGWPASGANWGLAAASVDSAKQYWDEVGCSLFGKINVWWYTLLDANAEDTASFAITDNLSTTPIFNLTCPAVVADSASASSTGSSSGASSTGSSTSTSGSTPATGGESASGSSGSSSATAASAATAIAPSYVAALVLAVAAHFML